MAKTDLKLRYNGSVLGFMWSLLKPLSLFFVLNIVFTYLFKSATPFYSLQLFVGLVMWNFFAESTMAGISSIVNRAGLLTKQPVPKWAVVLSSTITGLISFVFQLVILIIFFVYSGVFPSLLSIGIFIASILLEFILILGINIIMAPLFVRLRDIVQIWEVVLIAGFYLVPVIYPLALVPNWLQRLILINPLARLVEGAKQSLIFGIQPNLFDIVVTIGTIGALCFLVLITSYRISRKLAERL